MRKFTIGQLEIRRLSWTDIIWIFLYSISILLQLIFKYNNNRDLFTVEVMASSLFGLATTNSTLGLKFRSVYFSIIWLFLSIALIDMNCTLTLLPLLTFLLYHIARLIFWKKHIREFIPFQVGRGAIMYRYISKIENKGGTMKDKKFMRVLFYSGWLLFFLCAYGMIGKHY